MAYEYWFNKENLGVLNYRKFILNIRFPVDFSITKSKNQGKIWGDNLHGAAAGIEAAALGEWLAKCRGSEGTKAW